MRPQAKYSETSRLSSLSPLLLLSDFDEKGSEREKPFRSASNRARNSYIIQQRNHTVGIIDVDLCCELRKAKGNKREGKKRGGKTKKKKKKVAKGDPVLKITSWSLLESEVRARLRKRIATRTGAGSSSLGSGSDAKPKYGGGVRSGNRRTVSTNFFLSAPPFVAAIHQSPFFFPRSPSCSV